MLLYRATGINLGKAGDVKFEPTQTSEAMGGT